MTSIRTTYRWLTGILACMVLMSSTGFSIDTHICQGHIRSISLFGEAKSCMEKAAHTNGCSKHNASQEEIKKCPLGCCHNHDIQIEADDDQYINIVQLVDDIDIQQFFVEIHVPLIQTILPGFENSPKVYKPPKIIKSIYRLFNSFLL